MNKLKQLLSDMQANLWFVPGAMVFFSSRPGLVLIEIDSRIQAEWFADFPRLFGLGEAEIESYPHSVILFHDSTVTFDGDINRAKYLAPPVGNSNQNR